MAKITHTLDAVNYRAAHQLHDVLKRAEEFTNAARDTLHGISARYRDAPGQLHD